MKHSLSFIRILFLALCILFLTTYTTAEASSDSYYINLFIGIFSGIFFGIAVISLDTIFKRFNLRVFNTATIGLFFGYLMGEAILIVFQTVLNVSSIEESSQIFSLLRMGIFLFSCYLGMVMTARASDELYISIPFIKFKSNGQKKKDLLIDSSILLDTRIIDLSATGLLDHHLVIPRFLLKELYEMSENADEMIRSKARRCLEVVKKLESVTSLDLRYADADFPEIKDHFQKIIRLARLLDANVLTADSNRVQQSAIEGIRIINIHSLSSCLKPLAQMGEFINIKIQRYGKEARQGVGYLDDGTMVVVNGGAEYIGEGIRAQVLSVKHTSSGRMIFCNALEESLSSESPFPVGPECESTAKSYFAL